MPTTAKRTPVPASKKTATPRKRASTRSTTAAEPPATGERSRAGTPSRGATKKVASPRGPATRDPEGGLTAAGRKAFAAKDGSHLKPGVMKAEGDMSAEDMKRKGSWAARFYGRATLPPLVDKNGKPTRFALSAHAWGEKVPKTEADARKIAEKGRRLVARAAKSAAKSAVKSAVKSAAKTTVKKAAKKAARKATPRKQAGQPA